MLTPDGAESYPRDQVSNNILRKLGSEKRNEILGVLFIARSDVNYQV